MLKDTLDLWLDDFLRHCQLRGFSPRTIRTYGNDLRAFVKWVVQQGLSDTQELTAPLLESYQMHILLRRSQAKIYSQPRTLTAQTRNRILAQLRTFFRYLKKSGKLSHNPTADLERAREPQKLPKAVLTVPEVERLLAAVSTDSARGLRDLAALEVLYGTGIRSQEFLGLCLADLRLEEALLHILGKGSKERVVPLGPTAAQAVRVYLERGRPALMRKKRHNQVFVSAQHGGPLSSLEFSKVLKDYAKQTGLKKNLTCHLFRHSVATHLLQRGADLRAIQAMLGHAKLDTTAIYTRVDISDLQKTLLRCHPREADSV
jgi:integrase/recombinase XerD